MQKIRDKKLEKLKTILQKMGKVVVAYSGGVDSTFLLSVARSVLDDRNVLAITALSESYPASERRQAQDLAKGLSVNQLFIKTDELKNRDFVKNPVNRCYYCKKELFRKMKAEARKHGFNFVLDGSTLDDLADMRYGRLAAKEEKIRSPIQEAGLGKQDIRRLSKKMCIKNWSKPSSACLASRFSYNQKITKEKLKAVEKAEDFIKDLGFGQLRIRCHDGKIARIEVAKDEIKKLLRKETKEKIIKKLKSLGFVYITLDLTGYRTGSMNEELH
ncbi:ATP-dependent sacrificial sulfur transferase LarE [Omnitrophica bacterium]|nr:ATP-dependent sacrificial sulfur transferase LarE [Candidatus Omnitrophota bacterium]